jgi:membrane protease YdiL (CAAX protease family)
MSVELKLLIPIVGMAAALFAMRRSPSLDFGLRAPPLGPLLLWVAVFAAWTLGSNAIWHWRGPWDFSTWRALPVPAAAGRVLAVGLLGPVAEELIFRGFLYTRLAARGARLANARFAAPAAVLITAVLWAALHYADPLPVQALFVIDGLLLGAARATTANVWTPVAMHIVWNMYAVW